MSIFRRFRDITTFTVQVTACDLEKSYCFYTIVKIVGNALFLIRVYTNRRRKRALNFPRMRDRKVSVKCNVPSQSRSLIFVPYDH